MDAQAALARWCRKNRLADEERVQWQIVLQLQPDNAEAIQGIGLKPYGGMLLTMPQIQQFKAQMQRRGRPWIAGGRWWPSGAMRSSVTRRPRRPEVGEKVAKISDPTETGRPWSGRCGRRSAPSDTRGPYHAMLLATVQMLAGESASGRGRMLGPAGGLLGD